MNAFVSSFLGRCRISPSKCRIPARSNANLVSTTSKFLDIQDVDGNVRQVHYFDSGAEHASNHIYPPLVILGGTGQTIDTYAPHIRPFSKERRLLIIELRCQGKTELLPQYGTIQQHVTDFKAIVDKLGVDRCDLLGFSFGGRVGLAVAANLSGIVSKLTVTGVPLRRPAIGQVILKSWKESLQNNEMRSCAWSFIINGYSDKFLNKFAPKLSLFVDIVIRSNDPKKLFHLLEHSHIIDDSHPYSIPNSCPNIKCKTQVIASKNDRIAGHTEVADLSNAIANSTFVDLEGGHLAPFEEPTQWRKLVLAFLNTTA